MNINLFKLSEVKYAVNNARLQQAVCYNMYDVCMCGLDLIYCLHLLYMTIILYIDYMRIYSRMYVHTCIIEKLRMIHTYNVIMYVSFRLCTCMYTITDIIILIHYSYYFAMMKDIVGIPSYVY